MPLEKCPKTGIQPYAYEELADHLGLAQPSQELADQVRQSDYHRDRCDNLGNDGINAHLIPLPFIGLRRTLSTLL